MKINETEDTKKELEESFDILKFSFQLGPLNFEFALKSYSQKFKYFQFLFFQAVCLILTI